MVRLGVPGHQETRSGPVLSAQLPAGDGEPPGYRATCGYWSGTEMHQHDHARDGVDLEPGTPAWSEWVKDYYRDVETYDWVDVADNLRGLEAFFHRNRARVVRNLVRRYATPDAPIIDAGCGTGLNLRHLPQGSYGIDINPRNVEILRTRLPNHRILLGDVEALPFEDDTFGTVLCTEVIEHIPNPRPPCASSHGYCGPAGSSSVRCRRARRSGSSAFSRAPARIRSRSITNTSRTRSGRCSRAGRSSTSGTRSCDSTSCSWPASRHEPTRRRQARPPSSAGQASPHTTRLHRPMRTPLLLYALALAVRLVLIALFPDPAYPDSFYYVDVARSLARGRRLHRRLHLDLPRGRRHASRRPGPPDPLERPLDAPRVDRPGAVHLAPGRRRPGPPPCRSRSSARRSRPLTWAIARDAGARRRGRAAAPAS